MENPIYTAEYEEAVRKCEALFEMRRANQQEQEELRARLKVLSEQATAYEADLIAQSKQFSAPLAGHGFETRLNPGKVSYAYDETAIRNGIPDSLLSTVFIPQPALFNPKVFNALLETEVINPSLANCKKQVPANPRWEFKEQK
jgi:hypothetical protein